MFGIKDVFTSINCLGGAVGIILCVEGRPWEAAVAIMLGYLLGDVPDGWVARKLGTQNQFGAEFDTIADHLAHCIAPGAVVYTVYRDADMGLPSLWQHVLAGALGSAIMLAASIRHARNIVRPVNYKGIWAGLPRSVLGFLAIAFANAALLPYIPFGHWTGVVFIPFICWSTLTYAPFPSHHLPRKHIWFARLMILSFFVTTFGAIFFAPKFMFDILFFWMAGYALGSWMGLTPAERQDFKKAVAVAMEQGA